MKAIVLSLLLLTLFSCDDDDNAAASARIPAGLVKTYNITCSMAVGVTMPFTDGQAITIELKADETLTVDDVVNAAYTMSSPVGNGTNDVELVWTYTNGDKYSVSNFETETFNEMNVNDSSGGFLGSCN